MAVLLHLHMADRDMALKVAEGDLSQACMVQRRHRRTDSGMATTEETTEIPGLVATVKEEPA
jgi:hypothetical protein